MLKQLGYENTDSGVGEARLRHLAVFVEQNGGRVFDHVLLAAGPQLAGVVGDIVRPVEPDEVDSGVGEPFGMLAYDAAIARVVLADLRLVPCARPQVPVGPQSVGDAHLALGGRNGRIGGCTLPAGRLRGQRAGGKRPRK